MTRPALTMTDADFEALRRRLLRTDPSKADAAAGMARMMRDAKAKFDLDVPAEFARPDPQRRV